MIGGRASPPRQAASASALAAWRPSEVQQLDRYELLTVIARGGMGTVYVARTSGVGGFQRLVAVKLLHPHLVESPDFVAMLLDEARVAAGIHHPNVVATLDVCANDDAHYIVMEYVPGLTFNELIDLRTLTPYERVRATVRVVLDALAGLDAAHDLTDDAGNTMGLVHRDVSPQNILVGAEGVSRLTDFGIARASKRIHVSRVGTVKGKPAYMAPEQLQGLEIDRRADLFAMGVVLWEGLTGRRLFLAGNEAATVMMALTHTVDPPAAFNPEVTEGISAVCLRALEREPDKRYATARVMATELLHSAERDGLVASANDFADLLRAHVGGELRARKQRIQDAMERASHRRVSDLGGLHGENGVENPPRVASSRFAAAPVSVVSTVIQKAEPTPDAGPELVYATSPNTVTSQRSTPKLAAVLLVGVLLGVVVALLAHATRRGLLFAPGPAEPAVTAAARPSSSNEGTVLEPIPAPGAARASVPAPTLASTPVPAPTAAAALAEPAPAEPARRPARAVVRTVPAHPRALPTEPRPRAGVRMEANPYEQH